MSVKVTYFLNETGRKASLLDGGDGRWEQTITVENVDQLFRQVVEAGTIDGQGNVKLVIPCGLSGLDRPHKLHELLELRAAKIAQEESNQRAREECRRSEILSVINRRITRAEMLLCSTVHGLNYEVQVPDWGREPIPDDIARRPDVVAWMCELKAAADVAEQVAILDHQKREAEKRAAAEQAVAKRNVWRASLGLNEGEEAYLIGEEGALIEAPVYKDHKRANNWMAIVTGLDPTKPGGLARLFTEKARGDALYILPAELPPGTVVEFGADYRTGSGNKTRERWYGYVKGTAGTADGKERKRYLVLVECDTARVALQHAEALLS